MLGWLGLMRRGLLGTAWVLLLTPLHWLLLSLAAWRALYQLIVAPYVWEKTEHGLAKHSRLNDELMRSLGDLERYLRGLKKRGKLAMVADTGVVPAPPRRLWWFRLTSVVVGDMDGKQALVFLPILNPAQIQAHFERLKAETSGLLDAFLCVHEPARRIDVDPLAADFRVSSSDAKTLLPRRYADMQRRGGRIMPGFTDLTAMPVLLDKRLSGYAHIWLVEYDVDFAGPWTNSLPRSPAEWRI